MEVCYNFSKLLIFVETYSGNMRNRKTKGNAGYMCLYDGRQRFAKEAVI